MLIRREHDGDAPAIRQLLNTCFPSDSGYAPEARLVDELRADPAWKRELSFVAADDADIIGYVLCTRATLDTGDPVLALAPLAVDPHHRESGVGSALVYSVLGAADALGESIVCVLGDPTFYERFGFEPAAHRQIEAPADDWRNQFMVRPLTNYHPAAMGTVHYARPFAQL